MRLYRISDVQPGMINGKSIFDVDNVLLLSAGFEITPEIIEKLLDRGYNYIYIMEEGTEEIVPEDIVSFSVRLKASNTLESIVKEIKKLSRFNNATVAEALMLFKEDYVLNSPLTFDVRGIVKEIIEDISYAKTKILNTIILKSRATFFVDHAINTAILAVLIGLKYRLNRKMLTSLAIGSILHDIGKIVLQQLKGNNDPRIIKLLYHEHPAFGYRLLKGSSIISPLENQIVFQHHETQDGSGFPSGLKGKNLPPTQSSDHGGRGFIFRLAEICSVANSYDRTVLNPYDTEQFPPVDVIRKLIGAAGTELNKNVIKTFVHVVPAYPLGIYVKVIEIDDRSLIGYCGVVAEIDENDLSKPVIILITDNHFSKIKPMKVETRQMKKVRFELLL